MMQQMPAIALPRLPASATNLTIAVLLTIGAATGLASFLGGSPDGRWVVWLHAADGFSLSLILLWKRAIIVRSLRRHRLGLWALPSLLLLVLVLASLASGILWSTIGLPSVDGVSGLTLHVAISAAIAVLVLPHARAGWPSAPRRILLTRRSFLRTGLLFLAGTALWRGSEAVSSAAHLSGSDRRFTGSREVASFQNNAFPANNWLLDDPEPIATETWRLRVFGSVATPLSLALGDLPRTDELVATLDCTGGWFSQQRWQGVTLSSLLQQANAAVDARSIVVRSATGYWRRFSIEHARNLLLAARVGGEPLAHEHGAPLRLVASGRRGYDWVKWVTEIEVSSRPSWWRWPLPLS